MSPRRFRGHTQTRVSPRVVFDTTVVVSALLITSGRLAWLRAHWRAGDALPLASRATIEELTRVLRLLSLHLPEFRPPGYSVSSPPELLQLIFAAFALYTTLPPTNVRTDTVFGNSFAGTVKIS